MAIRIFLVEDSAAMRANLIDYLVTHASVEIVAVAETEAEATDWLKHNPDRWDIALVDLFLRAGTGVGVVEHCRKRSVDQTVLVMTNHVRDQDLLRHCKLLGADAIYDKATELDDLVAYCIGRAARVSACPV